MKPFLDFDDPGAGDDHPARGVTVGDVRAWHDHSVAEATAQGPMVEGYNLLRGALAWFSSHEVEQKLGHLPQWVTMGRELTGER